MESPTLRRSRRLSWQTFRRLHADDAYWVLPHVDRYVDMHLFFCEKQQDWDIATVFGGTEFFADDGTTVKQTFYRLFDVSTCRVFLNQNMAYHVKMTLTWPTMLYFQTPSLFGIHLGPYCLTPVQFTGTTADLWATYPHVSHLDVFADRDHSHVRHPTRTLLQHICPEILFRHLCLWYASRKEKGGGVGIDYVKEYAQAFPKHKTLVRLCRHVVRHWLNDVFQAYLNVHVRKTRMMKHAWLLDQLHLHHLHASKTTKTTITFDVVQEWIRDHCHPEDALVFIYRGLTFPTF
jgi:hypothetical protein